MKRTREAPTSQRKKCKFLTFSGACLWAPLHLISFSLIQSRGLRVTIHLPRMYISLNNSIFIVFELQVNRITLYSSMTFFPHFSTILVGSSMFVCVALYQLLLCWYNIPSCEQSQYICLFSLSGTSGLFMWLFFFAIMNWAAVNILIPASSYTWEFL